MSPSESQNMTRREKASIARTAIESAGPLMRPDDLRSDRLYSDVTRKIVEVVNREGLSEVPLDERDVVLALQALHFRGIVKVSHYDSEERPVHSVAFLKKK